ncbi:MAG: thioredoxin-disulfide reductase [Syntrophales bacterium]|nr:thioredoxin-disulfide reductase [Syntrophales bacterium]
MIGKDIPESVYDIIIIGGGPAGLTAGLYASRANLRTLLIEGTASVSQITTTDAIENYPGITEAVSGMDLVELFRTQALRFGLEMTPADVKAVEKTAWKETEGWKIHTSGKTYEALALIVATGASWRKLGVPGEEAFTGKGVSYCATCDGPFYKKKDVAVVGGGNAALQEALFLTHFAEKVTIIHRRDRLRAAGILQKRAFANPRIAFAWKSVVDEIKGGNGVEAVKIHDTNTGATSEIPIHGIFIFIGLIPNTDLVRGIVHLEEKGAISVDRDMKTSIPGIFACGDCTDKLLRQVVTACGDGATAAYSAQLYVENLKGEAY